MISINHFLAIFVETALVQELKASYQKKFYTFKNSFLYYDMYSQYVECKSNEHQKDMRNTITALK